MQMLTVTVSLGATSVGEIASELRAKAADEGGGGGGGAMKPIIAKIPRWSIETVIVRLAGLTVE